MPLRPGYNTQGKSILLFANYMNLAIEQGLEFFRYAIDIGPGSDKKVPSVKRCKRLVQLLLEEHFANERGHVATDSRTNLISAKKLDKINENEENTEFSVRWKEADEIEYRDDAVTYVMKVTFTGPIAVSDLINYLTSANVSDFFASKSEVLQALNIVVGEHPKSRGDVGSRGANIHFPLNPDPSDRFSLGEGLEAIRGYFVSVRAATARLLVNVQVKYVAVYEHGSLASLIGKNPTSLFNLEKFLKTVRVALTHFRDKNGNPVRREKTIWGFARKGDGASLKDKSPRGVTKKGQKGAQEIPFGAGPHEIEFWMDTPVEPMKTPGYITVAYWFKIRYNMDVDKKFPVVNVGSRDSPTYVPVDICQVVAGQPAKMKLSGKQMRQMLYNTVDTRSPGDNANSIVNQGAPLLGFPPKTNKVLEAFGLNPNSDLITVPGRTLQAPRVTYRDISGKKPLDATIKEASWNLYRMTFYETGKSTLRWTWVVVNPVATYEQFTDGKVGCKRRIEAWAKNAQNTGILLSPKPSVDGVEITSRDMFDPAFKRLAGESLNFVLVVLPFQDTSLYNTIKYLCDIHYGLIHSCVVVDRKFLRESPSYDANVAMKVNLKLSGTNHIVGGDQLGIISQGKTMLVGIDVTHPSPGSAKNAPSIAAIVASVDKNLSQYPAQLHVQTGKQEKVDALDILLKSRLKLWHAKNNEYPENIIIYRDGVSEGQYDMVVAEELPQLRKACRELCGEKPPRISIVIVGKRHHTRFYVTKADDASKSHNPPNGTVVDRGITEARAFDFFLQSHSALKGTARPAHYIVVHDEVFKKMPVQAPFKNAAEVLIDLSHKLCYTYNRASKAVSICPPAYYADKVAERARCYLHDMFDPKDAASEASAQSDKMQKMVTLHEKVKNIMFYV